MDTVKFAGFEITNDTVRTCRKYLDAIRDFPTPANITDVRSWFELINQVSYAFAANERILPFCQLLKPGAPFVWDNDLNNLFEESKSMIIDEIEEGVHIFDKSKLTCLAIDWSKTGIGYWLFQKHCRCPTNMPLCCRTGWKTTLVGSHFTHAAESRYYPIEGEALAVADALDKARFFVLGCSDWTVAVDHKPLLKVLGDRSLQDIPNARLRNLTEKTLRHRFRMVYIPGIRHKAADAVSRHPTGPKTQKCGSYQMTVTPVIHLPHPHLIHTSAHSWITSAVTSCRSHHAPLQSTTSCIISFISAAYYSSHMGQGQSGDSERRQYGTPDVHH